jgi:hypothetical protein
MARVRGRVINSRGEPVTGAMLMLMPDDMMIGPMNMNNAMVGNDGAFQFANVAPGRYNLQVRPNGMPSATSEFAAMKVTVGNDDIDNLLVATSVGATARGVVLTDDGSVPTFRPDQVSIFAGPVEPMAFTAGGGQGRVNDDFTFELTSLSDRRLVRANVGQNLGWYLKAILLDGDDVTDSGVEFTPGRSYDGLQVIFTRKSTDLSGLVTDDRHKPVLDATVVIFPANKELWTFSSRFVRSARPDTNGRYNVKSLPPSEDYLVIAVQNLEQGQASDPEFLARAAEEAQRFTLSEGEFKSVDVRVSKLVP